MSWSDVYSYGQCPRKYLWSHGWPGIDVGGGEGKKKPRPVQVDKIDALMGKTIQRVLEDFYNYRVWERIPDPQQLLVGLKKLTEARVIRAYKKRQGPHSAEVFTEMMETCLCGVENYITTLRGTGLWGIEMGSEVPLELDIGDGVKIGGRIDFLSTPENGSYVLDGKNSKHKAYVDSDQLRWYAVLYKGMYGHFPKKLGFVWFRFPFNAASKEKGITWHKVTEQDETRLIQKSKKIRLQMVGHNFEPTPSQMNCRFCDYSTVCPERYQGAVGDLPEGPTSLKG